MARRMKQPAETEDGEWNGGDSGEKEAPLFLKLFFQQMPTHCICRRLSLFNTIFPFPFPLSRFAFNPS